MVDSLYSDILKESRKIYVQLPASFNRNKTYLVAFILDGATLLPTVNSVQNYYSGGFTPDMILIGICNKKNRTRDLTTSTINSKYGMPFNDENGKADTFINFIENELIPFIENKYPVTNFRTLIGHSYGGLFTVYTLIKRPHIFTNYLAIDPSLDWDNQKLLKEARLLLNSPTYNSKSLFVSLSGQLHMQNSEITINNVMKVTSNFTRFSRSNIEFSNIVKQNANSGLTYHWKFYPKDLHGTVAFPFQLVPNGKYR